MKKTPATKSKRGRREQVGTKNITTTERNNMFAFWFENDQNIVTTAKEFTPRSRQLIYKIKAADDWDGRAAIINQKVKVALDRKIAAKQISNVTKVQACFDREVVACLKKHPSKVAGSPQNIVLMAAYIDKAQGALPPDPSELAADIDKVLLFEVYHILGDVVASDKQPAPVEAKPGVPA